MIITHTQAASRHMDRLRTKAGKGEHLIGVAAGSGLTAKYAVLGGCDMLLALSSGRYRTMGVGSLAGFLCYANSNDMVMEFARKELLRYTDSTPVFFGLNAADPSREMYQYIREIRDAGFTGIVNYPTIGMIDGRFREALEEAGPGYGQEVEAISFAHYSGLLTLAFVFNAEQARRMTRAGADIICAHFGLTGGGCAGAEKVLTLEKARLTACEIFSAVEGENSGALRVMYGGPVKSPIDAEYMYQGCGSQGYIGGSVFERIPIEAALLQVMKEYRSKTQIVPSNRLERILHAAHGHYNYVDFVLEYINESYMHEIHLSSLARSMHISPSYLSTLFRRSVGKSFRQYLVDLRMKKAEELIRTRSYPLVRVAQMVGYKDYATFSKMYKKVAGFPPRETSRNRN